MERVAVVMPAAGLGMRMRAPTHKPYIKVGGEPILLRTLRCFAQVDDVREVVLVVNPDDLDAVRERWDAELAKLKVKAICAGGARRQDSVYQGLLRTSPDCEVVLIHDAVRPLVSPELIRQTIDAVCRHGAAIVAARVKETVKEVNASGRITATRPRDGLWLAQTPQGFRRGLIIKALEQAQRRGLEITDDAQAVEAMGELVYVVPGDYGNLKITTPEDLAIAEALIARRPRTLHHVSSQTEGCPGGAADAPTPGTPTHGAIP